MVARKLVSTSLDYKAFQQQDKADLVIGFYWWGDITISRPAVLQGRHVTKEKLKELLLEIPNKQIIVIILDKRMHESNPKFPVLLDQIEEHFRKQGFNRIIIQDSVGEEHPDGLPILRDTQSH